MFRTARSQIARLARRLGDPRGLIAILAAALAFAGSPAAPARAMVVATAEAPMILQGLLWADLVNNRGGVCNGTFNLVIKNMPATTTTTTLKNYLDAAQKCGLKVIFHFTNTIVSGVVYPSRAASWVAKVRSHPALAGYLSVKEPSWVGVNGSEIRALYRSYKAADPNHPVYGLFGDIPHFGDTINTYTAGMADIVMVDWYPVETASGGCSRTGASYVANGPKWYAKVAARVAAATPGTPVIAMLQTHKYLGPTCHKKQLPTQATLWRQAREALTYGGVVGLAFHTWSNTNYQMDEARNPTMVNWMRQLAAQIRGGTFQ
jgi:hypothetical protein